MRLLIAMGCAQQVDGLAVLVDGPVEVLPLALDLDVDLRQLRRKFLKPAVAIRMINRCTPRNLFGRSKS